VKGYFPWCEICGAPGHKGSRCPARRLQEMQDPYGNKRRVAPIAESIDPALREATPAIIFLPSNSR
jgi:hypothetical protein